MLLMPGPDGGARRDRENRWGEAVFGLVVVLVLLSPGLAVLAGWAYRAFMWAAGL